MFKIWLNSLKEFMSFMFNFWSTFYYKDSAPPGDETMRRITKSFGDTK